MPERDSHYVSVHALDTGTISMPRRFFVTPIDDPNEMAVMPCMSFLIQHHDRETTKTTRILFDLGIRADTGLFPQRIRDHILASDKPANNSNIVSALAKGDLSAKDIDYVIFSHLHWDHIGSPTDLPNAQLVVGAGGLAFLAKHGVNGTYERDLFPDHRTIELAGTDNLLSNAAHPLFSQPWKPTSTFENTLDIFGDGSLYVVDTPGHMPGHINLLCRLEAGRYVYLAGDLCHDARILTGQKDVSTWPDAADPGILRCAHVDKAAAVKSIERALHVSNGGTELGAVEIVLAHDGGWAETAKNAGRFFPGQM